MPATTLLSLTRQQVTTLLTMFLCGLWVITAVVRIWIEFPAAYVLDAAMPLIIGHWFAFNASALKRNGNGNEVPSLE